ncbi:hypothetical protein [Spirochaeta dissipatitropha]
MKKQEKKIPDLIREQQVLNELSPELWKNRRIIDLDSSEKQALLDDNERLLGLLSPEELTEKLRNRDNQQNEKTVRFRSHFALPGLLAAAAVCLALVGYILSGPLQDRSSILTDPSDEIRLKGADSRIYIYRQDQNSSQVTLNDGDEVSAGDVLQLAYRSAVYEYGLIASVDGTGHVSLHYPSGIFDVPILNTQTLELLPYAFRLDSAPDHEQFIFMLSDRHFPINDAVRWIEENLDENRLLPLDNPLPENIRKIELVTLLKEQ